MVSQQNGKSYSNNTTMYVTQNIVKTLTHSLAVHPMLDELSFATNLTKE